jgi:serine/threonine-protein kinase HipA
MSGPNNDVRLSKISGRNNVPTSPDLDVFTDGRPTGKLARSGLEEEAYLFDYAAGCRDEDTVSLTMPIMRDQYHSMSGLLPIFEMNLPEGALLERLRHQFAKLIPRFDSLNLLSIVGQSQIGRLRYAASGTAPTAVPEQKISELLTYAGAEDLFADLLRRYAEHSGISGVQPKVLVREEGPQLPRLSHRGATHIVKSFDPREFPELAANEYFCTRAAKHAGIAVPSLRLSYNRRILVAERFDLNPDGSYLGCEDFCVLSGLRAHGRYEGSYERVAERIGQFVSPENRRLAFEQLFATLTLCCAIGNGDAHLKNFAVLYENAKAQVSLAPSYDLVCTTLYHARDVLALTLAGSKSFPDRKRLTGFARIACGLSAPKAAELMNRVSIGVQHAIKDVRLYVKKHADFAAAAEKLIACYEQGVTRIAA